MEATWLKRQWKCGWHQKKLWNLILGAVSIKVLIWIKRICYKTVSICSQHVTEGKASKINQGESLSEGQSSRTLLLIWKLIMHDLY